MTRVEIDEAVFLSSAGIVSTVRGASVQVNIRGGGAATVYAAEVGGTTLPNPLTTDIAGRIDGWVDAGSYDLVVSGSSITSYTQSYEAAAVGPTGPAGPPGVGAAWKGVWSSGTTYAVGDGVYRNNAPYISNSAGNLNHDPATDTGTNWGPINPAMLGVDVWNTQANPSSVTDWGPIINTLIAGSNKRLSFGFGHTFPFSTKINLDDLSGIVFETASSAAHVVQPQTKLLWKGGVGSGNALSMKHADGCEIGVSIEYDHTTGYNGDLILVDVNAGGAQGSRNLFKRAMFGSDDIGTTHTARSILNFAAAVDCTVEECMIVGAQWTVRGRETGIPLAHTDNNNFLRCGFNAATSGFFCNVGENWTIEGCTFEFGSLLAGFKTPSVFDSDMTHTSTFEFIGNRLWDFVDATQTPISQKSQNTWNAVISRNFIDTAGGVNISLLGPGSVTVEDNRFSRSASNGGTALIDLGSSVSAYKAYARIKGNVWSASSLPANVIANISGHGIVDIGPNSEDSGFPAQAQSVRTFVGHERTYWPTAYSSTIAMAAGQPATTLDGVWGDSFGIITIQPTGGNTVAGHLATVTFGTTMEPSVAGVPNAAHKVPLVNVWPYAVTGDGVSLSASWDAGFMVEVVNTQQATWRLHTRNVVPSGTKIGFGYRVIQL